MDKDITTFPRNRVATVKMLTGRGRGGGGRGGRGGSRGRGGYGYGSATDRLGPKLPAFLINQLGSEDDDKNVAKRIKRGTSRKDKRRQGRLEKKKENVAFFRQKSIDNLKRKRSLELNKKLQQVFVMHACSPPMQILCV